MSDIAQAGTRAPAAPRRTRPRMPSSIFGVPLLGALAVLLAATALTPGTAMAMPPSSLR